MTPTPFTPDGETRTSRIVGSVDFKFPVAPPLLEDTADLFKQVSGVRCAMPFLVKVATSTGTSENVITETVKDVFNEVESTLSNWNPNSEINKVNMMKVGEQHKMSNMLKEVVLASKEIVKLTRGAFDPSIAPILAHYKLKAADYSSHASHASSESSGSLDGSADLETSRRQRAVINIWKDLLSQGYSSDPKDVRVSRKVKELLQLSQWSASFSVKSEFISKKHNDACLDLSGIAKGFAVDEIARRLPSPCYVEWGGDIKVVGNHPTGRPWNVAVMQPRTLAQLKRGVAKARSQGQLGPVFTLFDEENECDTFYLAILELHDGDAVVTSGDCEKVVEKDGKLFSHIINPHLGRLLEINDVTLAQAVIVCKGSCMFADALSTVSLIPLKKYAPLSNVFLFMFNFNVVADLEFKRYRQRSHLKIQAWLVEC